MGDCGYIPQEVELFPRLPVTVTTRIITFLVGNPYEPSFATVTGRGTTQGITPISGVMGPTFFILQWPGWDPAGSRWDIPDLRLQILTKWGGKPVPIWSMGLVYLPRFTKSKSTKCSEKCTMHGSYGVDAWYPSLDLWDFCWGGWNVRPVRPRYSYHMVSFNVSSGNQKKPEQKS